MHKLLSTVSSLLLLVSSGICEQPVKSGIVIIEVNDQTIRHYGTFPWGRDKYGNFFNQLYLKYSPKVVFSSFIHDIPSLETPELDNILFESIKGKKNLLFCAGLSDLPMDTLPYEQFSIRKDQVKCSAVPESLGGLFPLPALIKNGGLLAISSKFSDEKGYFNNFPTINRVGPTYFTTMPIMVFCLYSDIAITELVFAEAGIEVRGKLMPYNKSGMFEIDYSYEFKTFTYQEVMNGSIPQSDLKGKIVVFGANATGWSEFVPTSKKLRHPSLHIDACAIQTLISAFTNANAKISVSGSVQKIGESFINDPEIIGMWQPIDFVNQIDDFLPAKTSWKGKLLASELVIKENGKTDKSWLTWSKGYVYHSGDATQAQYFFKRINEDEYLFMEHISGDVIKSRLQPKYYVYKKGSSKTE